MIEYSKWIYAISAGAIGAFFYYLALIKNERKRPEGHEGYICPRCRQGFDVSELHPIWQFPTAPLRLMGCNRKNELDSFYCKKCRVIVNIFLALSIVISLPIVFVWIYMAAYYKLHPAPGYLYIVSLRQPIVTR